MNSFVKNSRMLTAEELLFVGGGGGTDPLPNVIYSWQTGQTEDGNPLFYNVWYSSQGEFLREEKNAQENAYLEDLRNTQNIENSINDKLNNSIDQATEELRQQIEQQLDDAGVSYNDSYNYYYNGNFYDNYFDSLPRTFSGQLIDFFGVGTYGGELAYA